MNSEEIAKLAHVSRSTVSRVLNNYKNVPLATREKVQKVIDQYGYTPNNSARMLAGKSNNIIGVFLADINDTNSPSRYIGTNSPYNMELLSNVITSCKRRGYLTLVNTITEGKECQDMEQYFDNRMLYGGIFVGFPYGTKELEMLAKKEYNVVLIDQFAFDDDHDVQLKLLNCDNVQGGYDATCYLLQKGHKKIAHITGDHRLSSIERQQGFLKAVTEAGLTSEEYDIVPGEYREDIAYEQMKKLLARKSPTAVFVANDIMALGVIRAIQEHGLKVPQDVSVIGYDNIESAEWMQIHLTSMGVSMEELAERSVALLFSKDKGQHELCQTKLFERSSVCKIE